MEKIYKIIIIVIISVIILALLGFWIYNHYFVEKALKLVFPIGGEVLEANKKYEIKWKARNIGKVGIMLARGDDPSNAKYIVEDFPAGKKKYEWQIFTWQASDQNYKISIFEYPWAEGNLIDYSKTFTIAGPEFASCDSLSIDAEWPFIPSDYPNLRRVFITSKSYKGNLEGLEGADKICQEAAKENSFEGNWKAFLGDDQTLAVDRLKLEGVFIEAIPAPTITEGKTCHRLLGKDFNEFFAKLSDSYIVNKDKMDEPFFKDLASIWLGRVNKDSKRDCIIIDLEYPSSNISLNYSFTTTCQNWTSERENVEGYPAPSNEKTSFSSCYTPKGQRIDAIGVAGLSAAVAKTDQGDNFSPYIGKSCGDSRKLLCIEQ